MAVLLESLEELVEEDHFAGIGHETFEDFGLRLGAVFGAVE